MNNHQKSIIIRLILASIFILGLYGVSLIYFINSYNRAELVEIILFITFILFIIIAFIWIREHNLYRQYHIDRRIKEGKSTYVMCPRCRVIQQSGKSNCEFCKEEWILCGACQVPFEKGSSVLISPCCGLGFHRDHFESALRETSKCPVCESKKPLVVTEW